MYILVLQVTSNLGKTCQYQKFYETERGVQRNALREDFVKLKQNILENTSIYQKAKRQLKI